MCLRVRCGDVLREVTILEAMRGGQCSATPGAAPPVMSSELACGAGMAQSVQLLPDAAVDATGALLADVESVRGKSVAVLAVARVQSFASIGENLSMVTVLPHGPS